MNTITSKDNPSVRACIALREKKRERRALRAYVCEGEKILCEAVREGVAVREAFFTEAAAERRSAEITELSARGARIYTVPDALLAYLSDVESPQGVVFTAAMGERPTGTPHDLLVCDEVRDPGNLGTILRTADAFGAGGVFLCGDCADPYAPKVVRACMGSLFRVPLYFGSAEECAALCRESGLSLYCAKPREDAFRLSQGLPPRSAIAIGNEAHGVREELCHFAKGSLYVDMSGRAESLNAAVCAAIILWHQQLVRE